GADALSGGSEDDLLIGGAGGDTISGNAGNDLIVGDNAVVTFASGNVSDVRSTSEDIGAGDTLHGNEGNDVIIGGAAGDTVTGDAGNDVAFGDSAHLVYSAGALTTAESTAPSVGGADTITGGSEDDVLVGGAADDTIFGNTGNDLIVGDNAAMTFTGGKLSDARSTSEDIGACDTLYGNEDNDVIIGGAAGDTITGDVGKDLVFGDSAHVTWSGANVNFAESTAPGVGGADTISGNDG